MTLTRRNFLGDAAAASALASFLSAAEMARGASKAEWPEPAAFEQGGDLSVHDPSEFWDDFYNAVDPSAPKSRGAKGRLPEAERRAEFLHAGPAGLRYVYDIKENELLDHHGDVLISMVLGQFRPGSADQNFLKNVKTAQLRVDAVQTKPFLEVLAPLAWTAMASVKTNNAGKLPDLKQLGFTTPEAMSGTTKVFLPGGMGKVAVNIYSTKGDSFLQKLLRGAVQYGGAVASFMNFPAVSVPALRAFQEVYSRLEEQAAFLMNSQLTQAVATRDALADPDREENFVHLLSGDYVLVPKAHLDDVKTLMDKLEVQQGYLVRKDAASSDDLETRANNVLPDVTYATLRMTVAPAATGAGGGGGGEGGGGGGGAAGGAGGGGRKGGASGAKPKETGTPPPCSPSGEPKKKP